MKWSEVCHLFVCMMIIPGFRFRIVQSLTPLVCGLGPWVLLGRLPDGGRGSFESERSDLCLLDTGKAGRTILGLAG